MFLVGFIKIKIWSKINKKVVYKSKKAIRLNGIIARICKLIFLDDVRLNPININNVIKLYIAIVEYVNKKLGVNINKKRKKNVTSFETFHFFVQ